MKPHQLIYREQTKRVFKPRTTDYLFKGFGMTAVKWNKNHRPRVSYEQIQRARYYMLNLN